MKVVFKMFQSVFINNNLGSLRSLHFKTWKITNLFKMFIFFWWIFLYVICYVVTDLIVILATIAVSWNVALFLQRLLKYCQKKSKFLFVYAFFREKKAILKFFEFIFLSLLLKLCLQNLFIKIYFRNSACLGLRQLTKSIEIVKLDDSSFC